MSDSTSIRTPQELREYLLAEFDALLIPEFLEACSKDDNLEWFLRRLKQESLLIVANRDRVADEDDECNPLRHLTRYE